MNKDPVDQVKTSEEQVQVCAHCGAENPPGLLLCLTCGREPSTGRDLFASPEAPTSGGLPPPNLVSPSSELTITLPDPIQVPDPLPIPSLEDFGTPPPQPPLVPPAVYRAPPSEPKQMPPLLSPGPRWTIGLLGWAVLAALGLGTASSLATLNLPGGLCLGSVWLAATILWMGILSARRGESRSTATGARRRLVTSLGQRLFEITPGATKEQLALVPVREVPSLAQPASQLFYLNSAGDRTGQLMQVLLGTICALIADDHIQLATQSYDVLTASPLKQRTDSITRAAVFRRTLYVGTGYLEKLVLQQLRQSTSPSVEDLAAGVLRQAGADLMDRIASDVSQASPDQGQEAPDLDAQIAALREFCEELKTLNPELHEQLTQEVEAAIRDFITRQRTT